MGREQLLNAVARVGGRRKERLQPFKAQLLAFMGAKGGCGVTSVVTQLGAMLANSFSISGANRLWIVTEGDVDVFVTRNSAHGGRGGDGGEVGVASREAERAARKHQQPDGSEADCR